MSDATTDRLAALEAEVARLRRRDRRIAAALAVLAVIAALFATRTSEAVGRREIVVASADGRREARLTADGLVFATDDKPRFRVEVGESWSYLTVHNPEGAQTFAVASESGGTSLKIFSAQQALRVEVSEQLIDSGAGVRLYDRAGAPRATFFADRRGGESGVALTDANRQPRIDIFAAPDGVSVIRASSSAADAAAELSILPESDAMSRYTGGVPEPRDGEPLQPMLWLLDRNGANTFVTPNPPR